MSRAVRRIFRGKYPMESLLATLINEFMKEKKERKNILQ